MQFRDKPFVSVQLNAAALLPRQNISPNSGLSPTTITADFALGKTVS
jgi:hypothetical protein